MSEFYVKVEPGAEEFRVETSGDYPRIFLESPASQGRANEELVRRLSDILGCDVAIVSGHRSKRKKMAAEPSESRISKILSDYPG